MKNKNKKWEQQYLPIREISRMLGISQPTLRYYESEGLVHPVRSESSKYRKYSFLSLIELTDIILYRNLGIPVKKIQTLLRSPIMNSLAAVDEVIDDTYRQLEKLQRTLRQLSLFERKVRKYLYLQSTADAYVIVKHTEIRSLYTFSFDNEVSMGDYISNPYSFPYGIYIADTAHPEDYIDCIIETSLPDPAAKSYIKCREELVWKASDHDCRYLVCLMRTEYGMTAENDLDMHLRYMKEHHLTPGTVVGSYLTYDYSPKDKKRYDYYQIWIQIVSE